ncbi:MAG: hypothetical protein JWM85_777 [Acidimicrobiaceae bacterium]|nr:hypothetical protein [Acidimicrobiaceae bacterium]
MLVFVLVLVWVAALLPIALKKRSQWQLSTSVSRFHHSSRRLSRSYPHIEGVADAEAVEAVCRREEQLRRADRERVRARRARRRRVLVVLSATIFGSFLLGAVPSLRPLWDLSLASVLLGAAYCALLVRIARIEADVLARPLRPAVVSEAGANTGGPGAIIVPIRPVRPAFVIVEATS